MDMAFLGRADRMLAQDQPARIDHSILVAALAAQKMAQASTRSHARVPPAVRVPCSEEPLIELLLGGPAWRQALAAQRGCFSRAEAGRRINGS